MSHARNRKLGASSAIPRTLHADVVRSFLVHHCAEFKWQPRALGLLRSKSIKLLLDLAEDVENDFLSTANPDADTVVSEAASFLAARQFKALVTKYQYSSDLIDLKPEERALANFLAAEHRNRRLNTIFRTHFLRGTERHWSIPLVRKYFQRALGERPFIERILDGCDFSGGATTMHSGAKTHLASKLGASKIQGGTGALWYFKNAIWRNFSYMEQLKSYSPLINRDIVCIDRNETFDRIDNLWEDCCYNVVKVVSKNAKSGRTIAKEPPGNNLVQKGIDLELRVLLKRAYGIDLSYQEPNQLLACRGSVLDSTDPYVTIDVKDASTSVITWLVRSLSNPFWFQLMDQTRSHKYRVDDGPLRDYEVFATMGNGFCFPLETHIFAAICSAAYEHCGMKPDFRCYGDDIVVRQSVALVVKEILHACGFRVNVSKTFIFGPFRESCGANWYGGQDVTPGYYKDVVTNRGELYALHNSLLRWPVLTELLRSVLPKHHVVEDTPMYSWVTNHAFRVPLDQAMVHPKTKWDPYCQTWRYKILSFLPVEASWEESFLGVNPDRMRVTAAYRGSTFDEPFHLRFSTTVREVCTGRWTGVKKHYTGSKSFVGPLPPGKSCEAPGLALDNYVELWAQLAVRN